MVVVALRAAGLIPAVSGSTRDFAPMHEVFALHVTWTCYATWLPGDERGYVSNTLQPGRGFQPKENLPGTPYRKDDEFTRSVARSLQKYPTARLNTELAHVAANAMVEAARSRGWRILRAALMANHVHVVIADCPNNGESVRRVLKGTSQAAMSEHVGGGRRWWTAGGSDRYKNDEQAVVSAVDYVARQEGKLVEIVDMAVTVCADTRRG